MTIHPIIALTAATRTRALAGVVFVDRAGDAKPYVMLTELVRWSDLRSKWS